MKRTKRILAGLTALSLTAALTACGSSSSGSSGNSGNAGGAAGGDETEGTTTTAKTVEINTEELKEDEQTVLEDVMSQLQDTEMENKTVKWLSWYDLNPNTATGASKSVALEMFEQKYGGTLEYIPCTWGSRFDDLATKVLGGDGIDIFPGEDTGCFPNGIVNGMFQPVDDYIDINAPVWQSVASGMELMNFGGKHYMLVTSLTAEACVLYDYSTIEEQGFDDPWELYENGEWNWDTFKNMLLEFVDPDSDQYGLDGYWNEKALLMSAGVPFVSTDSSGNLVCNINDPSIEKAMNFMYELNINGLKFPKEQFNWNEQPQMMGEGKTLFYIIGPYAIQKAPDTWVTCVSAENCGVVPVPSPEGSDPWQGVKLSGFPLCKGAANPKGAALFAECNLMGSMDERTIAISDRKSLDDFQWTEDILRKTKEIDELARKYPVYDLASGCSKDIASLTTDGGDHIGLRAAFSGIDWATTREECADVLVMLVDEVDKNVKAKQAEGN